MVLNSTFYRYSRKWPTVKFWQPQMQVCYSKINRFSLLFYNYKLVYHIVSLVAHGSFRKEGESAFLMVN